MIAPLIPLFEARQADEAIARPEALPETEPRYAAVPYCLACAESLTGRSADAIGHLRTAVEMNPTFAEYARNDDDFAAIRDEPEFAAVMSG